jgi:HNH endonuclease
MFIKGPVTRRSGNLVRSSAMGRIPLLHLFTRPDQHRAQRLTPVVDEPEVQPPLNPALFGERTRAIPQDVKIEVAARDGGRCRQCGSNKELHFDHVIPWSKGGANTADNIQLLCGTCNRRKGADETPVDLPPSPYRQAWHPSGAEVRPSQSRATYRSPPPPPYMSEQEWKPTCPVCGMPSALHTGADCHRDR